MNMDTRNKFLLTSATVLVGLLILVIILNPDILTPGTRNPNPPPPPSLNPQGKQAPPVVLPTKTEAEKAIIARIETNYITITSSGLDHPAITIKRYDQVEWGNKDTKPHKLVGKDWGGVIIQPGRNFSQAFDTVGTFSYTDELDSTITGTVTVK